MKLSFFEVIVKRVLISLTTSILTILILNQTVFAHTVLGGDGQEPWPLSIGNMQPFSNSEISGFWRVEETNWFLQISPVKKQKTILMAQLWDNYSNTSLFNGPVRIFPRWVEGIALLNKKDFCSIYMFRFNSDFKLRLTCNEGIYDYNLKKLSIDDRY